MTSDAALQHISRATSVLASHRTAQTAAAAWVHRPRPGLTLAPSPPTAMATAVAAARPSSPCSTSHQPDGAMDTRSSCRCSSSFSPHSYPALQLQSTNPRSRAQRRPCGSAAGAQTLFPDVRTLLASLLSALALAMLGPGEPAGPKPAAARIPTETVLSDGGGSGRGGSISDSGDADAIIGSGSIYSSRAALLQLAVPPSALIAPAEAGEGAVGATTPGAAAGSAPGAAAPSRVPGTMVGTPNYARRGPMGRAGSAPGSTASEAAEALRLLGAAREAVDGGRHAEALDLYGQLVSEHPDLALAEYGRIGRAMMLYQVGRTSDSILALEDESVTLVGSAEVHAALAALLYSERPTLALRAEEEWDIACAFDTRYSDTDWVRVNKHWPPRMIAALQRFLSLS